MIKVATKCNPSIQSNAILALAGLLNIVHRYTTSLEPAELKTAELSTEYKSHSHWLMVVIESLMSLVDFQYKPKGELLGLCQQVIFFFLVLAYQVNILELHKNSMLVQGLVGSRSVGHCPNVIGIWVTFGSHRTNVTFNEIKCREFLNDRFPSVIFRWHPRFQSTSGLHYL